MLDVSMASVAYLASEEDYGGGDTITVLETLEVGEETTDYGSLLQGLGDGSLQDIVHVEDETPFAQMAIESALSSESKIGIDASQISSVHVIDVDVEDNEVAQTSLLPVQSGQESIEEPVQ